jgi:enamine deaminase RidA (YjgF/YER057c/UK114 family)
MAKVADRLAAAGMSLPSIPSALGSYVPAVRTGTLVFTSGQLPIADGELQVRGLVGAEVSEQVGAECAATCALNALAAAASVCDLDAVTRVVKLVGYVASAPGFTMQPSVVNGASNVLAVAFEDAGRHAREAVGVTQLPLGAPVEVSVVLEVSEKAAPGV